MILSIVVNALRLFSSRVLKKLIRSALEALEKKNASFATYHFRPQKAADCHFIPVRGHSNTGIVMQGPPLFDDEFTIQTLQLYRQMYPDCRIILSTWNDVPKEWLQQAENLSVDVCLNRKPERTGIANLNFQIASSRAGIEKARSLGLKHILKTRTDQRFYCPDTLNLLHAILNKYAPASLGASARILAVSLNSFRFRPYSVSDMFLFGTIEDQERFWSAPLDPREGKPDFPTLGSWSRAEMAEVYLVANYLRALGWQPDFTLKDSWAAFRDLFSIVDASMIDLYWPKYERFLEHRYPAYSLRTDAQLTHAFWLALYEGSAKIDSAPEAVLKRPFGTTFAMEEL
ncbi:MAG: hypothetical protein KDK37_10440 [Leptospiraceae bacterium]|nr:hypothetical protein [Leptospiraceae bacterium]MCB1304690.1 hypothetical protein [Leptospiraceae bacterium]